MIFNHQNYRSFLKAELMERMQKNESYSLRAFAKSLDVSPAALSRVLKGQKGISLERAHSIASRLKLDEKQTEYLFLLVQLESAKNPEMKGIILTKMNTLTPDRKTHNLSVDLFMAMADWYHLAILECFQVSGLEFNASEISKYLGISKVEAELAIERLARLELIDLPSKEEPNKKPSRAVNRLLVSTMTPNDAIRKYYKQILLKASEAIEAQSALERVAGTEVFSFDPDQLNEVRKKTDTYLKELVEISQKSKNKSCVYQANVQVFRLNQLKQKQKEK